MWICIFRRMTRERHVMAIWHILREASALFARSTAMGIPGPRIAERATGMALTLFLYNNFIA